MSALREMLSCCGRSLTEPWHVTEGLLVRWENFSRGVDRVGRPALNVEESCDQRVDIFAFTVPRPEVRNRLLQTASA
jgi:hypothetical protein